MYCNSVMRAQCRNDDAKIVAISIHTRGSHGRHGRAQTINQGDCGSIPPMAVSKLRQLPMSFGSDTKTQRSLLSGVYARGSKISHTGGKCVTCSGLTNSREGQL